MSERIVVGLSGGVDSALAAALLQERGFDVVGCFLKVVVEGAPCPWESDLPMAHRVAAHLNIPLIVKDVSAEYEREVLKPMVAAYQRGETPNPDTTCNRYVKFDALAAVAREVGADRIATGHYARVNKRGQALYATGPDPFYLHRALDHTKDQSYFLWMLTQEQLAMCEFPIGEWRKEDVRAEAKRRGLPNWDRESTSGVCFLGQVSIAEFLTAPSMSLRAPTRWSGRSNPGTGGTTAPATVVTTDGVVLGTVPAGEALTIGQRVPIAGQSTPHYVVATCPKSSFGQEERRVVVAAPDDPARYTKTITAGSPHWIGAPPLLPFSCTARIRHRQEPVPCTVTQETMSLRGAERRSNPGIVHEQRDCHARPAFDRDSLAMTVENGSLHITFSTPLTGVAPGQAVVLTDGDRVLGGAVITRTAPNVS